MWLATARQWTTRILVLLTGGVGLAPVGRAALVYRGADLLAYRLVQLIALGLAFGTLELFARAGRAVRIERELAGLPRPATREAVERSGAPLRSMLEARIAGAALPPASATF